MEPWVIWISAFLAAWGALILLSAWISSARLREDDFLANVLYRLMQLYARVVHNLRVEGRENIPAPDEHRRLRFPLIVAANHTAGIDPILIQAPLWFEPRWMMAQDMRAPQLDWLWTLAHIIFVDRTSKESRSAREALRHLKNGGALGVFPEGHIERPPEHLLPFRGGIGFLIAKSGAAVLPVVISGTPQVDPAWASLTRPSRSVVRFLPVVHYEKGTTPDAIGADLERRFAEATGWPRAPRIPILDAERRIMVDLAGNYVDDAGRPITDAEARAIAATDASDPEASPRKDAP